MRSWLAVCAVLLLLVGCSTAPDCDVCPEPGGWVNVDGQVPRTPFTVRICVTELDIPCTERVYEKCRPSGEDCTHNLDSVPPPGDEERWTRGVTTIRLSPGGDPKELDGREVTVTIEDRSETQTTTAEFDYRAGGECCGDQADAVAEFRTSWKNSYPEGWLTLDSY